MGSPAPSCSTESAAPLMDALARALTQRRVALWFVFGSLVVTSLAGYWSRSLQQDDDLLAFLPRSHPDVEQFYAINERFGGLQVALVGLQGDDLFERSTLESLKRLTSALDDLPDVTRALSITNLEDMSPDPEFGGIRIAPVVDQLPTSSSEEEEVKARVLSRDHVVGTFVSVEGDALLIYCFTSQASNPRTVAEQIRARVEEEFPGRPMVWGGSPFVSTYIFETTQRDMDRLIPWSVLAILLVLVVTFRDPLGTVLALVTTGMGIIIAHGAMAAAGVPFNIVLSSMPVILFAVGSAYSIHILSRYYRLEPDQGATEAMGQCLRQLGPVVLASGLTTVAGLLSFLTMDIQPMRDFGLFTALGILATLLLSLTFVPAVVLLCGLRRRKLGGGIAGLLPAATAWVRGHRLLSLGGAVLVSGVAAVFAGQVDSRMDHAAFFSPGSPPAQAERFLTRSFGGAQFVQVLVQGDLKDPDLLRELRALADELALIPTVSDVLHVGEVIARANEVMEGVRRIPDSAQKTALLYGFLSGNKAVAQLVDEDRTEALIQVKSHAHRADDTERLLRRVEERVAARLAPRYRRVSTATEEGLAVLHQGIAARLGALVHQAELPWGVESVDRAVAALGNLPTSSPTGSAAVSAVREGLEAYLRSEECIAELPAEDEEPGLVNSLAQALAALGPAPEDAELSATVAQASGRSEDALLVQDLLFAVSTPIDELWAAQAARQRAAVLSTALGLDSASVGDGDSRLSDGLAAASLDLDLDTVLVPTEAAGGNQETFEVDASVSGLPVLHRGMSESVQRNQRTSLLTALGLVFVILSLLFRSPASGLLATLPTAATLLVVFGVMGAQGVHLDIGTSMLAGLIIGAGVDYGVHLVSAWRVPPGGDAFVAARNAAAESGPAIWTNAIMVAVGFYVLTLGEARPLQNVGRLTAGAMICAAIATFVLVPSLAQRRSYLGRGGDSETEPGSV